ncbi:hypothetical protein H4R19_006860, partial [Coemansia spiralis]
KKRKISCTVSQCQRALTQLISALDETLPWFVHCINPNDNQEAREWDREHVQRQLAAFGIADIARSKNAEFTASLLHGDLTSRYRVAIKKYVHTKEKTSAAELCEALRRAMGWDDTDMAIGKTKVFLSFAAWRQLEDPLRERERLLACGVHAEEASAVAPADLQSVYEDDDIELFPSEADDDAQYDADAASLMEHGAALQMRQAQALGGSPGMPSAAGSPGTGDDEKTIDDSHSAGHASRVTDEKGGGLKQLAAAGQAVEAKAEVEEEDDDDDDPNKMSRARRNWLVLVWLLTWWMPSPCLSWCAKLRRKDQRIAWREKVALCALIFFLCCVMIFWIAVLGLLICPKQHVHTIEEMRGHNTADDALIAIRGEIFDIQGFNHMN